MGSWVWPLPGYSRRSSGFGWRNCPYHGRECHTGIDLPAPAGTRVIAARAGRVVNAGRTGSYGNLVIIEHGGGYKTYYAHNSSIAVRRGQQVSAGQVISRVGSTGNSTGNHLHFGVMVNGRFRDPLSYVNSGDTSARFTGKRGSSSPGNISLGVTIKSKGGKVKDKTKEITSVSTKSTRGKTVLHSGNSLRDKTVNTKVNYELLMQHDGKIYLPSVEEGITVTWERKGTPGKMEFTVYNDKLLKVYKGDAVRFKAGGKKIFFGYVFSVKHVRKNWITVTCYDQLRYLKNQDVMSYKKKTYSQLLRQIAKQYKLNLGTVVNTKYIIKKRMEEGTLFDILGNASDLTLQHTNKTYVLYDNFGKINLRGLSDMKVPITIDADLAQSYEYESTIDNNTYNRIKVYIDNDKTGVREVYVHNNPATQKKYGILQYVDKSSGDAADAKKKAKKLAERYLHVHRKLSFSGVFGDTRVRGGSMVYVVLTMTDKKQSGYLIVEKVTHTFKADNHTMDLELSSKKGGFDV